MAYLIRPHHTKVWHIKWAERDSEGRRHWRMKSTGTRDRDEAQEAYELFEAVRNKRIGRSRLMDIIRAAGNADLPEDVPMDSLWGWYETHCEVTGEDRTRRERHQALDRFSEWMRVNHPELETVREVSLKIASEYWKAMELNNLSPSTRNNNLSALNTIWSSVHAPMELESNPWSAIRRDRGGSVRYQPFTSSEMTAIRIAAREYASKVAEQGFWPAAIEMGYYTGLRLGDIATLDWQELVDDDDFLVLVPNKTRRWGDDRVAVHSKSLPWVSLLPPPEREGDVWPMAARASETGKLSAEFTEIARAAGVKIDREPERGERRTENVRLKCFHSLRHTFATEALRRGISEDILKEQGNWSDIRTISGHYNHAKLEQAKRAAGKVAGIMMGKEDSNAR